MHECNPIEGSQKTHWAESGGSGWMVVVAGWWEWLDGVSDWMVGVAGWLEWLDGGSGWMVGVAGWWKWLDGGSGWMVLEDERDQ